MISIPDTFRFQIPSIRKVHIKVDYELIYLTVFCFYCVSAVFSSSLFSFADLLFKAARAVSFVVLGVLWVMQGRIRTKRLFLHVVMLAVFAAAMIATGRKVLLVTVLFMMTSGEVKKEKIVRTSILGTLPAVLLIIAACCAGLLPDRVYLHEGIPAHSMGFTYYSAYPYILLFNLISYMYVRKKTLGWLALAAAAAANYMLYRVSTLRLSYYLTFVVLLMYILIEKFRMLDLRKKWVGRLSVLAFPVLFAVTIYGALAYTPRRLFWRQADDLLTGRISLSHTAFDRYAVKLFGQVIENNNMINGRIVTHNFFYVDSGYVYALLGYGVFMTLLLIVVYSYMLKRACEDNNRKLFIWLMMLSVFTVINNVWLSVHFNCVLLLLLPYLNERADPLLKLVQRWLHGETEKCKS